VRRTILLSGMLLMFSACGGDGGGSGGAGGGGGDEESDTVSITLEEQNNSGKSGKAELFPGAASTDLTLEVQPAGDNEAIHIHEGTCDSPSTEVAHDIGFTTVGLGQGSAFVTIDEVTTGEYVLDVHSAKNPDEVILCGVIPER
jgi:hypothetical protein